jgi:hypothetical protein
LEIFRKLMNSADTALIADLRSLAVKLEHQYYEVIESINKRLSGFLSNADATEGAYFDVCRDLVAKMDFLVNSRKASLLPYLEQLHGKERDGHNCSTCSGGCKVQHGVYIGNISSSHTQVKDVLKELREVKKAGVSNGGKYADKVMLYEASLINMIRDLIEEEQKELIPAITQAQKNINAH